MYPDLRKYCDTLSSEFSTIPEARNSMLENAAQFAKRQLSQTHPVSFIYICTHNSRRSQFGQVWAQAAAEYWKVANVRAFSGGTETTRVSPHTVSALQRAGFKINQPSENENPLFEITYSDTADPCIIFSKVYDHPHNPRSNFAAIMTCNEADANCPIVPGAQIRIQCPYGDPKIFDGTTEQNKAYDKSCRQIALETLYLFSLIKNTNG